FSRIWEGSPKPIGCASGEPCASEQHKGIGKHGTLKASQFLIREHLTAQVCRTPLRLDDIPSSLGRTYSAGGFLPACTLRRISSICSLSGGKAAMRQP